MQETHLERQEQKSAGDATHGRNKRDCKSYERRQEYPCLDTGYGKGHEQVHLLPSTTVSRNS